MKGIIEVDGGVEIKSWLPLQDLEDGAFEQAWNCAKHPAAFSHMALMPDCHQGYGMPIGGVMALKNAVSPAMVGVDIGCGISALPTSLYAEELDPCEDLPEIVAQIKRAIPCGEGRFKSTPALWDKWHFWEDEIRQSGWGQGKVLETAKLSLGTLGGGNHFIELQQEPTDGGRVWIMIHSGSRGFGYKIAQYYMKMAEKMDPVGAKLGVPTMDATDKVTHDYLLDMSKAMEFAKRNRELMMNEVKRILLQFDGAMDFGSEINIHHNFASMEEHFGEKVIVHRKGATQARKGQLGIIPGSMGTSSYIVMGKGNPESFESCSHGAGRVMGRMAATRNLDVLDVFAATNHITHSGFRKIKKGKLKGKLDLGEAPQAYKDIHTVIDNQADLVDVVHKLTPLAVVKG